jgi:hypothetical protein
MSFTSEGFVAIIEKLDIPCRDPLCRIYAGHYAIIARNVENMIDVYVANSKRQYGYSVSALAAWQ